MRRRWRRPPDVLALRSMADFYLRAGRTVPAEALLRRIVDGKVKAGDADMMRARRQLGLLLSSQGDYRNLQKARDLIKQNLAAGEPSAADRRAMAMFDAMDPDHARHDEAMRRLENLLDDKSAGAGGSLPVGADVPVGGAWPQAGALFRKLMAPPVQTRAT